MIAGNRTIKVCIFSPSQSQMGGLERCVQDAAFSRCRCHCLRKYLVPWSTAVTRWEPSSSLQKLSAAAEGRSQCRGSVKGLGGAVPFDFPTSSSVHSFPSSRNIFPVLFSSLPSLSKTISSAFPSKNLRLVGSVWKDFSFYLFLPHPSLPVSLNSV